MFYVPTEPAPFTLDDATGDATTIHGWMTPIRTLIDALDLALTDLDHPDAPELGRLAGEALARQQEALQLIDRIRAWQ